MRQNNRLLPLALALLIFAACASTLSKTPKWFLSPTQKKGYIYAVGTEKGNEIFTLSHNNSDFPINPL